MRCCSNEMVSLAVHLISRCSRCLCRWNGDEVRHRDLEQRLPILVEVETDFFRKKVAVRETKENSERRVLNAHNDHFSHRSCDPRFLSGLLLRSCLLRGGRGGRGWIKHTT